MTGNLSRTVKVKLAETGIPLALVARAGGLDYGRLQRVLHGYARVKDGEIETLLKQIDRLARLRPQAEA